VELSDDIVSTLRTRPSLLMRVQQWDDGVSWDEFYRLYRKLIYGLCRRSGLAHADAEEVTQDVFKRVAETIQTFESDPARGTFRGWLMNLTRWRIANKVSRRPFDEKARQVDPAEGGNSDTPIIERLPDPVNQDAVWEEEWQRHLLDAACERIARRANSQHYQAFDLRVRRGWPVLQVATHLGMNPAAVYLVGNRLTKQVKAEVAKLREQLG